MKKNILFSHDRVDKASHLREGNILNHKDFNINKIKLAIIYKNKFAINKINEKNYEAIWNSGKKAYNLIEKSESLIFLGKLKGFFYFSTDIDNINLNNDLYYDLRTLNPLLNHSDLTLLTTAQGINYWHKKNIYCGTCGFKTKSDDTGNSRICINQKCNTKIFPRLDPAVIMLITYKDSCLLGRQKVWPPGMHSTLAGFVEHGETVEQAVERETYEETGVRITNIQYKYSQAWPFPSSLMLGFHAEARDKSLNINYEELENASWYSKDFLKSSPENSEFKMPGKISIARKLIKDWLN
ncbi:MAG: NAD(+) diphosphatase [Pelagibacterales bacterium]|nr:NAD(+) diphosphatase [Pelagibacterales bacterium]PPR15695.1 MAG: NADH pyrophosphatase [Alphaproteobacteria bacterium MarineAlpha9_Bin3]|tara:strand:+ start:89 stop:979 length:891 start_codon:yes stop_codon:yes gene_type:complete